MKRMHTFVAYVEDLPGVLNRVSSLFRRRAFNIASLTVGRTDKEGVSRMTVMLEADEDTARRLEANLYKLVNVLLVQDLTHAAAVERDLMLVKVRAEPNRRAEIMQLCDVFRARVVDVASATLMIEATGAGDKLEGFLEVLRPFGIVEMMRTGRITMTRGSRKPRWRS